MSDTVVIVTSEANTVEVSSPGPQGPAIHAGSTISGSTAAPTLTLTQLGAGGALEANGSVVINGTLNVSAAVALAASLAVTGVASAAEFSGPLTGNVTGNVTGNAGTVTNGVYTTGSYADPAWITSLAKGKVGLGNVDNTADLAKPISTAAQTALDLKANLTGAAFTGAVSATGFTGPLTGNVTGNVSGSAGSVAASAITGTTLAASVVNASLNAITPTGGVFRIAGNLHLTDVARNIFAENGSGIFFNGYNNYGAGMYSDGSGTTLKLQTSGLDRVVIGSTGAVTMANGLAVTGALSATQGVSAGASYGFTAGGAFLYEASGATYLGGSAATMNLYAAGGNRATLTATGLSVTGALSATIAGASNSATLANMHTFTNSADSKILGLGATATGGVIQSYSGPLAINPEGNAVSIGGAFSTGVDTSSLVTLGRYSGGYTWSLIRPDNTSSGIEIRTYAGVAVAQFSSTGVAVTGALSATGNITTSVSANIGSSGGYSNFFASGQAILSAGSIVTFRVNGSTAEAMTLDASSNLGLGVTPSASTLPTIESEHALLVGRTGVNAVHNAYYDGAFKYIASNYASRYLQQNGTHVFYTAPSGTAGNAITFTQAMTLDASGNLAIQASKWVGIDAARSIVFDDGVYGAIWANGGGVKIKTGGTKEFAIAASGDVSVTGSLSATGAITSAATAGSLKAQASADSTYSVELRANYSDPNTAEMYVRNTLRMRAATNGSMKLYDLTGTERVDISSTGLAITGALSATGNITVNTTISPWDAGQQVIQNQHSAWYGWGVNNAEFVTNAYYNAGWKYSGTGAATKYSHTNGAHEWLVAASGSAGAAATFSRAALLDSSGFYVTGALSATGAATSAGGFQTTGYKTLSGGDPLNIGVGVVGGAGYIQVTTGGVPQPLSLDGSTVTITTGAFATTGVFSSTGLAVTGDVFLDRGTGAHDGILTAEGAAGSTLYVNGRYQIIFATGGTFAGGATVARATIDASGNLGLGVTPSASTHAALQVYSGGLVAGLSTGLQLAGNAFYQGGIGWSYIGAGKSARIDVNNGDSGGIAFSVASASGTAGDAIIFTQAMTLDASGVLLVGKTMSSGATAGVELSSGGVVATANGAFAGWFNRLTNDGDIVAFNRSAVQVGSVSVTTTATAYNTSSDRRLKKNIAAAGDAGSIIDALQVVQYDWLAGGHTAFGFVAQDEYLVYPDAVTPGDDGETITRTWGRDDSKLVPLLVKEVQTLRARVRQLETVH